MQGLAGKRVIVTGGSERHSACATARRLAAEGCIVGIFDRDGTGAADSLPPTSSTSPTAPPSPTHSARFEQLRPYGVECQDIDNGKMCQHIANSKVILH